jgi:protein involved in polysaccharide export with SLBB domain
MQHTRWTVFFLPLCALALSACAKLPLILDRAAGEVSPEYRIGVGDTLALKFYYSSELNETVTVRPDGRISLQLIGEVDVVGRTPEEIALGLEGRYGEHLPQSDVAVIVRDFASMRAYVGGEVERPRMVRLDGYTTLTEAVFASGGILDTAARSSVILLRRGEYGREVYRVDIDKCLSGEAETPVLRPYDVVYLPKSFIAKVGMYVDLYINRIVPRNANFTAIYGIDDTAAGF